MSEMKEILGYLIEIRDSVKRLEERMDRLEERMDRLEERMDHLEEHTDHRFKEFQEKMAVMEFALETEVQKVYEVVLVNQSDIKVLIMNQKWSYNDRQTRQQVSELNERVNVVEGVVQSHSEAIHKLQGAMA